MAQNENVNAAKRAKNDEFYTQRRDIENEVRYYRDHFTGKTVYCNCDDPRVSNFWKYFSDNFESLGLKRLIATCYKNQNMDLFSQHNSERAVMMEYTGDRDGNKRADRHEIDVTLLRGDGDFRSAECIELLKQSDIVCTNPPFSLFREYVAQLVRHEKQFLIIGNKNAITYKEIFPLIRDGKLWVGNTPMSRDLLFDVPRDYADELIATRKEGSAYRIVDGTVKGRSQSIWFTNLPHAKRNRKMVLYKDYSPEEYPHYDNYDAIEVGKTAQIPRDFPGVMGVPITFLDKYNPEQFEIVGYDYDVKTGSLDRIINTEWQGKIDRGYINGKRCYARIFIRHRK